MVPEDAYSSLLSQQQQLLPPVAMQLSSLDMELKSILNNPSLSVDEKHDRYYRTFNRYSQLQGKHFYNPEPMPPPPAVAVPHPPTVLAEKGTMTTDIPVHPAVLLNGLPKANRSRGRLLLEHLKHKKEIQWANSGELLADGNAIPGSNITDLLHFFTRNRPTVKPPVGAKEFAGMLQDSNVPKEAVVPDSFNQAGTLDFGIGTLFSPTARAEEEEEWNFEPKTPLRPQRGVFKTPPSTAKQKKKKTPTSGRKPTTSGVAGAAPLGGKRKRKEPERFGAINWEKLDIG